MRRRFAKLFSRSFLTFISVVALIVIGAAGCGPTGGDGDTGVDSGDTGGESPQVARHPKVSCSSQSDTTLCTIQGGDITQDLTLPNDPDVTYSLGGKVFVGDGSSETVLTIDPGVTIYARSGSTSDLSFLSIRQNSKIMAEGSADEPIVFTSSAKPGSRGRGDWGGLIINGKAPINSGQTASGEGGTGTYGGSKPGDDSGILKYVRVEFAGALITSENELNGIAFQGVGSGTTIDYIQVHKNADDGVEFFGGTANASHLVLTGEGDDSLDWTTGWQGKVQHVVAQQYPDKAGRGIEADNLEASNDSTPRSKPTISNMTIIGSSKSDEGILLRRGTGAHLHNFIVVDSAKPCLDIDSGATFRHAWNSNADEFSGELTLDHSYIHGCKKNFASDESSNRPFTVEEWFGAGDGNKKMDPKIRKPGSIGSPDYRLESGSPAASGAEQPSDSWFDDVDYIGGVGPNDDWTEGWTIHTAN